MNKSNALTSYSSIGDILKDGNTVNYNVYSSLTSKLGTKTGTVSTLDKGTPIVFTMAGRDWQVVYRDPNNSDIITVWMTDYYTTAVFNSSTSSGSNYDGSNIQTTVKNYFTTQASTYPVLNNITVSPSAMSDSYKTAQNKNGNYGGYTSVNGAISSLTDKFWIPSLYETFSFWGLDDTDRSMSTDYCWLRSGYSSYSNCAMLVYSSGSANYSAMNTRYGVRPAAHLSLSSLEECTKYKITTSTNNDIMGTTSGDGLFNWDGTESATITATPNYGYLFNYWLEESTSNKIYGNPYTFTVTQHESYTAYFYALEVVIATNNNKTAIEYEVTDHTTTTYNFDIKFTTSNYLTQIKFSGDSVPRTIKSGKSSFLDVANCTAVDYTTNTDGSKLYISVLAPTDSITITLYFSNTAQNYKVASGGGIETVAVQSTLGGSAELVGDDYENLTTGDTITVAARFKLNGYQFDGWYVDGVLLTTNMSARLTYDDTIKGKVIVAKFSKITSNTNTDTNNSNDFI